jgi:hypothetical protein
MVFPIRYFTHCLRFTEFNVYVDHKPLLAWKSTSIETDPTGRRVRWAMELFGYNFQIFYRMGKKYTAADALSRHPHPDEASNTQINGEEDGEIIVGAIREKLPSLVAALTVMETPLAEINAFKDNTEAMKKSQEEDPELKKAIDLVKLKILTEMPGKMFKAG